MEREQATISTSLRLTEEVNDYVKEKASKIGVSQNAMFLFLIDLGIKVHECKTILSLNQE